MARHWNPDLLDGLVRFEDWSQWSRACASTTQPRLGADGALLAKSAPGSRLVPQSPTLRALIHVSHFSEKRELLALRSLCRQSQPFRAYANVNEDAALLSINWLDLKLRPIFKQLENRLCHRTSAWRRGFTTQRLGHRAAAYWACRGISRSLGRDTPKDIEDTVALYCNNPVQDAVRLDHRALTALNNISFHWHRRFYQGLGGPSDAIRVALRILQGSGADVLKIAAFVRSGSGEAVSNDGEDLSEQVCSDGDMLTLAIRMLLNGRSFIEAHPARFGMKTQEAMLEDARFKSELRQREALEERMQAMGFEAMGDQRM